MNTLYKVVNIVTSLVLVTEIVLAWTDPNAGLMRAVALGMLVFLSERKFNNEY